MPSNDALQSVRCLCMQIPCVLQIMELKGAKAESECKSKALSEELQATKDALHRRNASLQRTECDQQVIHIDSSDLAVKICKIWSAIERNSTPLKVSGVISICWRQR